MNNVLLHIIHLHGPQCIEKKGLYEVELGFIVSNKPKFNNLINKSSIQAKC